MRLIPHSFNKYEMTEEEEDRCHLLSPDNVLAIQNMIADISEKKLTLLFTPNDVLGFTQQEAELAGQLVILKWLLERSESAQNSIRFRFSQSQKE